MRVFYLALFGAAGILFIVIAFKGSKWYFGNSSRFFHGRMGPKGTRIITGVIGAALLLYGIAYFSGWI